LKATSDMLVNDAREKKVSVVVQASPSQLHADRTLLTSALLNLLKNAIAASSEGGVVEVMGETTARGYRISVADSGHGIPPELQGRLFEPFFTTRAQGTGLGLPLTLKWVKAHGGEVRFSSRPGQTVFWLELPGAAP
jgi:two-component system sensor histidine kinase FlrB